MVRKATTERSRYDKKINNEKTENLGDVIKTLKNNNKKGQNPNKILIERQIAREYRVK